MGAKPTGEVGRDMLTAYAESAAVRAAIAAWRAGRTTCTALPFGLDPGQLVEPYCACGRVVSRCDRSRAACRLPPRP